MRSEHLALCMILVACLVTATPAQEGITVGGQVLAPDGVTPVPLVIVVLDDPAAPLAEGFDPTELFRDDRTQDGPPFYNAQGEDGELRIRGVKPGTYRVSVYSGREMVLLTEPMELTVVEGQPASIRIVLPEDKARPGVLVEADEATGVPGWMVGLVRPLMGQEELRHMNRPPEDFRVAMTLPDGSFWLFGDLSGEWTALTGSPTSGEPIVLGNITLTDDRTEPIRFVLPPMPKTQLTVLGQDGAPVANTDLTISMTRPNSWGGETIQARTGADGRANMQRIGSGTYEVTVTCERGWAALGLRSIPEDGEFAWEAQLRPGGSVELTVRGFDGAPLPNHSVYLNTSYELIGAQVNMNRRTDAEGRVTFSGLPPGAYQVNCEGGPGSSFMIGPDDRLAMDITAPAPTATQVPTPRAPTPAPTERLALAGSVADHTGAPAAGVEVYVDTFPLNYGPRPQGPVATDANGAFVVPDTSPGYHAVTVVRDGRPVITVPLFVTDAAPITIAMPETLGAARGRVMARPSGAPVEGVTVVACERRQLGLDGAGWFETLWLNEHGDLISHGPMGESIGRLVLTARTDAGGAFGLDGLCPGEYSLVALSGPSGRDRTVPVTFSVEDATTVELGDLALYDPKALRIEGRLVDDTGAPVSAEGVDLTLAYTAASLAITGPGQGAADGAFLVPVNRPGWMALNLSMGGSRPVPYWGAVVRTDGRPQPVEITVPAGGAGTATVTVRVLTPLGAAPGAEAWVAALAQGAPGHPWRLQLAYVGEVSPDGACTFEGLPYGRYAFLCRTRVDGAPTTDTLLGYSDPYLVGSDPGDAPCVVVEPMAVITGTVTAGGAPVAGARVAGFRSWSQDRVNVQQPAAFTDAQGRFSFGGVEPGEWNLSCEAWGGFGGQSVSVTASPGEVVEAEIDLPTGVVTETPAEDVPLPNGDGMVDEDVMTVSGVVVSADDGSPVAGAVVEPGEHGGADIPMRVLTDAYGRFELPDMRRWIGRLRVWRPGYAEVSVPVASPQEEWRFQNDPETQPVDSVLVELGVGAEVSGIVSVPDDDPALGDLAIVAMRPGDREGRPIEEAPRAAVGADGAFCFNHLAPGEHELRVIWGALPRSPGVTITAEEGEHLTGVELAAAPLVSTLTGIVTEVDGFSPVADAQLYLRYEGLRLPLNELRTDAQGGFTLHNLPPGMYLVQATIDDRVTIELPQIEVEPGEFDVLLAREQARRVTGLVAPTPGRQLPPGLRVALTYADQPLDYAVGTSTVAADGTYAVDGPNEGQYDLYLLIGRHTVIGRQRVTLPQDGDVRAADMVWGGPPAE